MEIQLDDNMFKAFTQYGNLCLTGGLIMDKENTNEVREIIRLYGKCEGITIMGNPGSGKTFTMEVLRRITHPKDKRHFIQLECDDLVRLHDQAVENKEDDDFFKQWDHRHVLLNELGTEKMGKYKINVMKLMLMHRHRLWERNKTRTHITSNLGDDEWADIYGVFSHSRFQAMNHLVKLGSKAESTDRRPLKNFKGFPLVHFEPIYDEDEKKWLEGYEKKKQEAHLIKPEPGQIKGTGTLIREQFERAFKKPNT